MLKDFILCDDVRNEVGNKHTLVGAFGDEIIIQSQPGGAPVVWPVVLPKLGVYIRLAPIVNLRPTQFSFAMIHERAGPVGRIDGGLVIQDPTKPIILGFVASPFPIPSPGRFRFELTLMQGQEKLNVPLDRYLNVAAVH